MRKEQKIISILRKHGVLVNYEGTALDNVRKPKTGETFSAWKKRVLGSEVSNVMVYGVYEPAGKTFMSTLVEKTAADYVGSIFTKNGQHQRSLQKAAVSKAKDVVFKIFASVPSDDVLEILDSLGAKVEPSVLEFIHKLLANQDKSVDIKPLLQSLITAYNTAVKLAKKKG